MVKDDVREQGFIKKVAALVGRDHFLESAGSHVNKCPQSVERQHNRPKRR